MFYLIIVCALAVAVQLSVAIAWRTWWTQSLRALQHSTELNDVRVQSSTIECKTTIQQALTAAREAIDRTAYASLRVEVDALAESVARLSRTNRAEFSRIYAKLQQLAQPLAPPDDAGAALIAEGGDAAQVGEALTSMGVNRVPRTGIVCTCGWCASCLERKSANA